MSSCCVFVGACVCVRVCAACIRSTRPGFPPVEQTSPRQPTPAVPEINSVRLHIKPDLNGWKKRKEKGGGVGGGERVQRKKKATEEKEG